MAENNMGIEKGQTTIKEPEIKPATPRKAAEYKGPWTPPPTPADKRNFLQKRWKQLVFTTAGLLGLAGSIYAVDKMNEPEPIPITSTFDASAKDAYITSGNSVQMALDEYEKVAPALWQEQERTMTIPLPILFRDNRSPTLHIEKSEHVAGPTLNVMTIDGLQQGDIVCSPIDGEIVTSMTDLSGFFLNGKDSDGKDISLTFATIGLNPLINNVPPAMNKRITVSIKKGDPIGSLIGDDHHRMFAGQIQITGHAPFIENFNLGTTYEGKAIVLK